MEKHSFLTTAVVVALFVVVSGSAGYYIGLNKQTNPPSVPTPRLSDQPYPTEEPKGVACTMDAKLCPDGSAVGRIPPDCKFAPCPDEKNTPPDGCIDYMGNPQDSEACGNIPSEGRSCSTNSDCTATCSKGCVSRTWMMKNSFADCTAMPGYTCECVNKVCAKAE